MASISLIRIDDRLVHGQVVTKWVQETKSNRIIIVDDGLVKNSFLSNVFRMAAPPGVKVDVKSAEEVAKEWNDNKLGDGKILMLFKSTKILKESFDKGFNFDRIQVAGLGSAAGTKLVYHTVSLSHDDAQRLKELSQQNNVEIFFQSVPDDKIATLQSILQKYFKDLV